MNRKLCYVTADSDLTGGWMEIEATSVFHAAIYYVGACASMERTTREIGAELGISAASVSRLLKAHHRLQNPAAGL